MRPFAARIALRRDPLPESLVVVTVKVSARAARGHATTRTSTSAARAASLPGAHTPAPLLDIRNLLAENTLADRPEARVGGHRRAARPPSPSPRGRVGASRHPGTPTTGQHSDLGTKGTSPIRARFVPFSRRDTSRATRRAENPYLRGRAVAACVAA